MARQAFIDSIKKEIERIDEAKISKRHEKVIEGFTAHPSPRAIIDGKEVLIFNSNDYLGLRFNKKVKAAEHNAAKQYGAGPGAVRFISGTLKIHKDLEKELARFHSREDAVIFSSAFALNFGVIHTLIKGQSKDSLISDNTLVISDELNHRSIIDGIRVAGLNKENKAIFKHLDLEDLKRVLEENKGKFKRVVIISDGIFSMLGEYQNVSNLQLIADHYDPQYEEGVMTIIDDAHGVAAFGKSGRGCEEVTKGKCSILLGTLGKGFGVDGGYAVGDKIFMDYIRESAATYIYSNPISPGTAGAALEAIRLVDSRSGSRLINSLNKNIAYFKEKMIDSGFSFAAFSKHAIQPVLIGDAVKTKALTDELFQRGILVTNLNYPVVQRGRDEIRVQLSSLHTLEDIDLFVKECSEIAKRLEIIK
ncbi:MAG: aminotransferase class I/II-fold pyridoxal phosphate-dependent enzyme [Candidatus Woesearchaeota archaeon]|nr:aminotransferase class I/II-fold pyridoxal phosphate-dependent enzyme [Candidatus Woesearchaeota archaeon]